MSPQLPRLLRLLAAAALLSGPLTVAQAQFQMVPARASNAPPRASAAEIEREYRIDAARHLYALYPRRIYRGRLPPLLYSVMVVETEIDAAGQVRSVNVVRKPAAAEVQPWVVALIHQAAPFPVPSRLPGGTARYLDIWLVDKSGRFQVDTLTEGQR